MEKRLGRRRVCAAGRRDKKREQRVDVPMVSTTPIKCTSAAIRTCRQGPQRIIHIPHARCRRHFTSAQLTSNHPAAFATETIC